MSATTGSSSARSPAPERPHVNGCCHEGDQNIVWIRLDRDRRPAAHARPRQSKKVLLADLDVDRRIDIADTAGTPADVLFLLAVDESADVRFALAENHNIDESVLRLLCVDDNPYVAFRASTTLTRLSCHP